MLKIDVSAMQSGVEYGLKHAKEILETARSSAASITVPSNFSMADKVRSLPNQISNAISNLSSAESSIASIATRFEEAEQLSKNVIDNIFMSGMRAQAGDFFSYGRASALGTPAKFRIALNNIEKTSPEYYNKIINNISTGCGISAENAKKIFGSITYDKSIMLATYDIINKCINNPEKYDKVFSYPRLNGSEVLKEKQTYENSMLLYFDLFTYLNLPTNGGKLIEIDENGNVKINNEARLQKFDLGKLTNYENYMQGVNFARIAEMRHRFLEDNNYLYYTDTSEESLPERSEELTQTKATCCATYVYWVCLDAKYFSGKESFNFNYCGDLIPKLKEIGFTTVAQKGEDPSEILKKLKPGDIVCYGAEHIEIYAGGPCGLWNSDWRYNAGSTESIQGETPEKWGRNMYENADFTEIIRVPEIMDLNL